MLPAGEHRAGGGEEVPGAALVIPAGDHHAICAEAVGGLANDDRLVHRVAGVFQLPLPTRTCVDPVGGSGRRVRFRGGLRLRVRRGLGLGGVLFAGVGQAEVSGVQSHELDVLVAAGLVQQAPGTVTEGVQRRVGHLAALEDLAVVPGEAVIVGDANRTVGAGAGGVGVGEEQDAGARGALGGIRVGAHDGGVVTRICQVPVVAEGAPGLAAVVGDGFEALAGGALRARVEEQATVGELDDLVLVGAALGGCAGLPGLPVVVGVDGDGHERGRSGVGNGVLLNEATGVGAVAQLDAFTGGSKAGEPLVLVSGGHLVGDGARVHPGLTVVVGLDDVGMQDVTRRRIGAQLGLEEAGIVGLHREQEDRSGGAVHDEGGVGVADLLGAGGAGEGGLDRGPGLTAILGDAVDDGVGLRRVLAGVRATVPRGDDPAVVGGGQSGDAVAAESGEAGGREAALVADRVVLRGLQRIRGRGTIALGDGHRVCVGSNATGDDVGAVAVTGGCPR